MEPRSDFTDIIDDSKLFLYRTSNINEPNNFLLYDFKKNIILKEFSPFKPQGSCSLAPSVFHHTADGDLFVSKQWEYTIYKLDEESITPFYQIEFNSKDRLPDDRSTIECMDLMPPLQFKHFARRLDHITQVGETLYITYILQMQYHLSAINVSTGESKTMKIGADNEVPFVWTPALFLQDEAVSLIPANAISPKNDPFPSDKSPDRILHAEDNPVLFFHKLKPLSSGKQ